MPTPEQEINKIDMGAPHVVILGAGASVASFPEGDRYSRQLPVMDNLVDILKLRDILEKFGVKHSSQNFEEIYSDLYDQDKHSDLLDLIEKKVKLYFSQLALPDKPTIYDHLILSLREKDIIATFNWDPLLYNACYRNHTKAPLPHVVYLHGNVAVGYCFKDRVKGNVRTICRKCGKRLTPSRLLFPIKKKNYADNPYIHSEWETLKACLKHAYILTIFGYGAPKSDLEAIALMKEAWGDPEKRNLEEIELIDIKNKDTLSETWKDFIHSHHYRTADSFYHSFIARHPRRSCEAMWSCLMDVDPYRDNDIPKNLDFEDLYKWYEPLVIAEKNKGYSSMPTKQ